MDNSVRMRLDVWEGDYGLVSLNIDCIQTILYAKIANAPVEVMCRANPYASLSRDFPLLHHGKTKLHRVEDIVSHFRRETYNADFSLTKKECSVSHAYANMISRNLRPVLEFVYWANTRNYEDLTRVWHCRAMYMPFNYYYVGWRRKKALDLMTALYANEDNLDVVQSALCKQAQDTLGVLSGHLGKNDYFFGGFATSIDALLYAHVAPLLKIPFPSQELANIVKSFPNLTRFVAKVDQKYFPELKGDVKYLRKEEDMKKMTEEEFHTSWKTKIFTFVFVFVAMFGYAASNNIIDMYKVRQYLTSS